MKTHWLSLFAATLAIGSTAGIARADILVSETRTTPIIFGGATYLVDFNGAAPGGDVLSFSTAAPNTKIVVIFNAEAACDGNAFNWVDVDIVVDPAGPAGETVLPPSNGDNAFVSGNDTDSDFLYAGGDGWTSAAVVATMTLAEAGTHTVKVRVNGAHCGISRFDDMSLVVMK